MPALIYATHAQSIRLCLGIDHVARSQAFFWGVQHSIASLDCVILLSSWLLAEPVNDQNLSGMLQSCCKNSINLLTLIFKTTKTTSTHLYQN